MNEGRPRTVTAKRTMGRPRIDLDRIEEGKALLDWALTDEALIIRAFPATRGYSYDTMLTWLTDEDFYDYYSMAIDLIGSRRELLLIKSNSASPFQRYATFYDKALHAFERKDKKEDSDLKKSENTALGNYIVETIDYATHKSNTPTQV